jgi:hypothetical protein
MDWEWNGNNGSHGRPIRVDCLLQVASVGSLFAETGLRRVDVDVDVDAIVWMRRWQIKDL